MIASVALEFYTTQAVSAMNQQSRPATQFAKVITRWPPGRCPPWSLRPPEAGVLTIADVVLGDEGPVVVAALRAGPALTPNPAAKTSAALSNVAIATFASNFTDFHRHYLR